MLSMGNKQVKAVLYALAHSLFDAVDEEEMSNEITLIAHDTLHHQSQFEKAKSSPGGC